MWARKGAKEANQRIFRQAWVGSLFGEGRGGGGGVWVGLVSCCVLLSSSAGDVNGSLEPLPTQLLTRLGLEPTEHYAAAHTYLLRPHTINPKP